MKKLLSLIFVSLLLSASAYAEDKKLYEMTQNKLNMLKFDGTRDLAFNNALNKGNRKEDFCKLPINRTINFNVAHKDSVNAKKWGCLSGNCDNGDGVYRSAGGFTYSGNFKFGRLNGLGIMKFNKIESTGKATTIYSEFVNGCAHGKGKIITFKGKTFNNVRFEYNKPILNK
jgi:hypothetical protein